MYNIMCYLSMYNHRLVIFLALVGELKHRAFYTSTIVSFKTIKGFIIRKVTERKKACASILYLLW